MTGKVLVIVEFLQLALLNAVQEDRHLVGVKFADHLGLLPTVLSLHQLYFIAWSDRTSFEHLEMGRKEKKGTE